MPSNYELCNNKWHHIKERHNETSKKSITTERQAAIEEADNVFSVHTEKSGADNSLDDWMLDDFCENHLKELVAASQRIQELVEAARSTCLVSRPHMRAFSEDYLEIRSSESIDSPSVVSLFDDKPSTYGEINKYLEIMWAAEAKVKTLSTLDLITLMDIEHAALEKTSDEAFEGYIQGCAKCVYTGRHQMLGRLEDLYDNVLYAVEHYSPAVGKLYVFAMSIVAHGKFKKSSGEYVRTDIRGMSREELQVHKTRGATFVTDPDEEVRWQTAWDEAIEKLVCGYGSALEELAEEWVRCRKP